MIQRIPLRDIKLWWPAWGMGIPFESTGYYNRDVVYGEGYQFQIDNELDSWLCADGSLMPIDTSKLCATSAGGPISWTSFTIIRAENKVQVNKYIPATGSFHIDMYALNDMYYEGDTYRDDE